jgi:hypothetical protein
MWPYRLRQLKEPGWSDEQLVEHLASVLREKPSRVRDYLSGRREPEPVRQLELGRMIGNHKKRQERSVMRVLKATDEQIAVAPTARGVFEMPFLPADYRGFYMVAEDGTLLAEIRVHKRAQERDFVPGFRAWLDRADPRPETQLSLVTPDAGEKVS